MKQMFDILILKKSEVLTSKKGKNYFTISFADIEGNTFPNVMITNIEIYDKIKPFNQYKAEIEIKNTLYGIKLQIMSV